MPSELSTRSNRPAIGLYSVGKSYRVYPSSSSRFLGNLTEALPKPFSWMRTMASRFQKSLAREFQALHDVSLEIHNGESVGIIGRNGSGKSTLLQLIAGTRPASAGHLSVNGRVAAILELGSGFKPDFTGRENVFINGLILGLKHRDILARFDEIADFADIGEFMDQPVKTYSSGMLVRLVFAVQVALNPEILIVDEALAVGDVFFQQKCADRIRTLKNQGTTILFVSHSMPLVRSLCDKVIHLVDGRLDFYGPTLEGTARFFANQSVKRSGRQALQSHSEGIEIWSHPPVEENVSIISISLDRAAGSHSLMGPVGESLGLVVRIASRQPDTRDIHIAFQIKNAYDQLLSTVTTQTLRQSPVIVPGGAFTDCRIRIPLVLEPGVYTFSIGIGDADGGQKWQRIASTEWIGPLTICPPEDNQSPPFFGPFGLPVYFDYPDSTTSLS